MSTSPLKYKLAYLGCLCITLAPFSAWAQSLKVGYFNLIPHIEEGENNTPPKGPAISYLKKVMEKSGVTELQIPPKPYPLSRLLQALELGKIDLAVALGKSPQRAKKFTYPSKPFLKMQPSFMLLKKSPLDSLQSINDILLMDIGIYEKGFLSPLMRDKRLKTKPLSGNNIIFRNYKIMLRERLDAVYSPDSYELIYTAKINGFYNNIKVVSLPEPKVGLYTVFSKKTAIKYAKNYENALSNLESYESYLIKFIDNKF
ncbi:transporter substrate-binding domain-containing protein [Spartinivicinus poritis]|uniref:Transporter substrate-binding domain-containing protein n=1 Tax=Spartinivicinus poritis TaxID=2994640 RepID=A0ABT5UD97_9GAMM|nr:transporter substrate-binding domain-containing protein [Spartinivicinus sp. A2-2]MDE1464297.1 transporter substrate-binding domain-containing protein [Spartinivicinus sp. A2-2]